MLDRIENKLIDRLDVIDIMEITGLFNCNVSDVSDILTRYFKKRKSFSGHIDLVGVNGLKSLYGLTRIIGDVELAHSNIEDLGNLKSVSGNLKIANTNISSTSKLTTCNNLHLRGKSISEIKRVKSVYGDIEIWGTNIESLNIISNIRGDLNLYSNDVFESMGLLKEVSRNLIIANCDNLSSLGSIRRVGGCLDVRMASLTSFGSLYVLDGFLISLKSKVTNIYTTDLDIIDFNGLINIFPSMEKMLYVKVPKIDNLLDFNMIIIDDINDDIYSI